MTNIIPTKFLIISDTHNFNFGDADNIEAGLRLPHPKVDVLLHCGDLTSVGGPEAYKGVLKMLGMIDAELKLVIAGNHDLDLDNVFVNTHKERFGDPNQHDTSLGIMTGPLAKEAGVTYLEEGLSTFTLKNGAKFTIYTSPYQPFFCDWAFSYDRDEDRFNLQKHVKPGVRCIAEHPIPDAPEVDIVMTHGPPKDVLDETYQNDNVGCEALMKAISRVKPLLHCFGHIHEAHGAAQVDWKRYKEKPWYEKRSMPFTPYQIPVANRFPVDILRWLPERGEHTLFVNASIMDIQYRATNSPFVVQLDLRSATS